MATLDDAIEWLERLRRKDLGPSADYAKILLDDQDERRDSDVFTRNFHDRFEYEGDDPWPLIDARLEAADAWETLQSQMLDSGLIASGASIEQVGAILRMFLPLD